MAITTGTICLHKKSEQFYTVIGSCRLEHNNEPAFLYIDQQGTIWARSKDEFLDGRFEEMNF